MDLTAIVSVDLLRLEWTKSENEHLPICLRLFPGTTDDSNE